MIVKVLQFHHETGVCLWALALVPNIYIFATRRIIRRLRFIRGLRRRGWTDTDINNFLLYLESGEEEGEVKPLPSSPQPDNSEK